MLQARDWALLRIAKRQEGVITDAQLTALGFSKRSRYWKLRSGEWIRVLPGVRRLYWADESWLQRVIAASLWVGTQGAISHRSAAMLHGFGMSMGELVDVSSALTPRYVPSWMRHFRVKPTTFAQVEVRHGIRVTSAARTLVDLALGMDEQAVEKLLRETVCHGVMSWDEIHREVPQAARAGRKGIGIIRSVLTRLKSV